MFSPDLTGPGVALPYPMALYPTGLINADAIPGNNIITLAPGQALTVPRGSFIASVDGYALIEWLDPVTTTWRSIVSARQQNWRVISDGNNWRVSNRTSCPVGAVVTNGGT